MPQNQQTSVRLLTFHPSGHTLNRRQALSPNRDWVVFDSRNDDTMIGQTNTIERIELKTGRREIVYKTANQTQYGPGVGAVAYHPIANRVVFIHGLLNCDASRPYGMSRRFGAIVEVKPESVPIAERSVEGRIVVQEPRLGLLSGGTHAHSWSPLGSRVSFTYNDARVPTMPRTVGFATMSVESPYKGVALGQVLGTEIDVDENFSGQFASFLVVRTNETTQMKNGDKLVIRLANEETWIGEDRFAFLGTIESSRSQPIQEIFVANLPSDDFLRTTLLQPKIGSTSEPRSFVPPGVTIERWTHTESQTQPGISGPRHWLTVDPSQEWIYTLLKDDQGIVQLARIATAASKTMERLTSLDVSIDGQMSCSPDGSVVGFICGGKIYTWSSTTRQVDVWQDSRWTDCDGSSIHPPVCDGGYVGGLHFVDNKTIIANRYLRIDDSPYLQIVEVRREY